MSKTNKEQNYSEADLVIKLGLNRIKKPYTPLMTEWISASITLNERQQKIFQQLYESSFDVIENWNEGSLKMKFLAPLLSLAGLLEEEENTFNSYFKSNLSATIDGHFLKAQPSFMLCKGILDKPQKPYFHFQEWKSQKNPTGDSMAQLLEALIVAQEVNNHAFPMYGCEVVGKQWSFVILEGKSYCISRTYDSTEEDDLLKIVAILRKFKEILETRILNK